MHCLLAKGFRCGCVQLTVFRDSTEHLERLLNSVQKALFEALPQNPTLAEAVGSCMFVKSFIWLLNGGIISGGACSYMRCKKTFRNEQSQ